MSMYKNDINVSLNIGANTQQAQQQIQALQQSLNKLSTAGFGANATKTMKEAAVAAQQLQTHLQKAFDTKTGNLNLGLLNKSLTSANTDISKLSTSLINAGADGRTAFTNLARSIASANQPMLKTNTLLNNMWTTLKNTARWQISSSILQGFMGSIQKAYGYAQDLNKSLTDIRIVTGHSTEYMKDFAAEANKAAKALSTTTNEYAKASLIYFQQGLNDQQVKERTDVTVKMANVTRESAQTVSDQMTAIWNNFDDGSKSLEYYADVITALGAATASSTDEISQGLEKFAAVAETVGLSYEYATAALATITAETRQSADVVGTALKTLFARIQGLSLGETLDDGTDLNKYSEALAKVGISIKEQNGELKDMDTILNEMAAKWETLNEDQQIALAQTVAGVRQYTQLVALMENWDSMKVNLDVAYNSEGTLNEQQDIYAESWEAASKRAKAALEEIYTILLDDSFFIKLTNTFADLTSGIGEFLKSFGGVKSILLTIANIFLMNFANKIPQAIETVRYNLSVLWGGATKEADKVANKFNEVFTNLQNNDKLSVSQKQQIEYSSRLMIAKNQLAKIQNELTNAESVGAQVAIQSLEAQQQEVDELYQKISELKNITTPALENASENLGMQSKKGLGLNSFQAEKVDDASIATVNALATAYSKYSVSMNQAALDGQKINEILPIQSQEIAEIANKLGGLDKAPDGWKTQQAEVAAYARQIQKVVPAMNLADEEAKKFRGQLEKLTNTSTKFNKFKTALNSVNKTLKECGIKGQGLSDVLKNIQINKNVQSSLRQIGIEETKIEKLTRQIKAGFEQLPNAIKHTASAIEIVSKTMGSFGTIAMGLRSIKSAFDTLADPDITGFEKVTSVIMSLGMGLPMVVTGFNNYKAAIAGIPVIQAFVASTTALMNAEKVKTIALVGSELTQEAAVTAAQLLGVEVDKKATQTEIQKAIAEKYGITVTEGETLSTTLNTAAEKLNTTNKKQGILATIQQTAANWGLKFSLDALLLPILLITAAIAALILIVWGIVEAIKAFKKESLEETLERQNKELEEITEQANKAREAFEKLKETITSYDEATKALEELEKGTEEYTQKLKEANDAARELIETFGITEGVSYENGRIVISQEAKDNAYNQYDDLNDAIAYQKYQKTIDRDETQRQIKIQNNQDSFKNDVQKAIQNNDDILLNIDIDKSSLVKSIQDNYEELLTEAEAGTLDEATVNRITGWQGFGQEAEAISSVILALKDDFILFSQEMDELGQVSENSAAKMLAASQILEGEEFFDNSEFQATLINSYMEAAEKAYDIAKAQLDEEIIDLQDAEARMIEAGFDKIEDENGKEVWEGPNGQIVTNDIEAIKEYLASIVADEEGKGASEDEADRMAELAKTNPALAAFVEQQNGGSQMSYTDQLALQEQFKNGQFFTDQNEYAQFQGFSNYEDMRLAAHYGGMEAQKALSNEKGYVVDQNTYDDIAVLNPYADLEAAFQQDLKEQMASRNYQSGLSADNYEVDINDTDYIDKMNSLKDIFSSLSEEEMKIMVTADLDLTKSEEEIRKDIQEVLQVAEAEDTYKRTAEATGWSEEAVRAYTQSLMANNKALAENEALAAASAEKHLIFAKGAQTLSEVLEENGKMLSEWAESNGEAHSGSMELWESVAKLSSALEMMFGVKFNNADIIKYYDQIQKAVKGDTKAILELQKVAAKKIVIDMELPEDITNELSSLVDEIYSLTENMNIGDSFSTEFIAKCQDMVSAAGMTADQIKAFFEAMNIKVDIGVGETPDISTEEVPLQDSVTMNQDINGEVTYTFPEDAPGGPGQVTAQVSGYVNTSTEADNSLEMPVINGMSLMSKPSSLGSAAKSNPTPKSSSGGGGGGGGEELKDPKNYEDEIERYHENTRALERLSRALDKVTTAKDRAFGKERLHLIEEEIAATEKLAAQQKSYLAEIEGYAAIDRSRMEGYGFTFDEHGEITNYNEIYRQQVDKFNASRTDAAEEAYNEFKDTVEQYEETITLLDEEQMKYQEYLNSLVDLKLEKITTEVEVKIRVNDTELTRLEYMLKKLQREGAAAADEIKNIADQINETMEKAGPIQEAIDKIYEQARAEGRGLTAEETAEIQSFYADGVIDAREQERVNAIYAKADEEDRILTQAEEEQIQEYKEQLLELNEEVWELADAIEDKLGEELDELDAEFDESLNRLTSYTQMYENLQNVLELTGKSKTAEGLNALNQLAASTLKNSTNALKANKANYDTFIELAAEANRHLQEAIEVGDQHMIDYWTEQVEDVTIRMEEAHVAMLESFNDALEAAGDLFDTKVENMITKLKKDLGDLDTIVELYDRAVELENLYLSSNQSIYELSKLTREVGKSIEDTSNLIAKNKLNDLMKELNKLRAEGVQLSKYDLEYLQAKYELELAEIALQEAQEAKSQVKLTRNNEGGWGYVYTADSDKVAEAEQNFEDKLYNMQQLNADYINTYSEALLKNREEMLNALAEIDKTREDYDEEVARVRADYMAKEEFYIAELTKAYERQGVTYEETILGMISNDESLLESHENFTERTQELIEEELIPAHEEWLENVQDICEEAGYSYDELTDGVLENMENVNEASAELTEKTLQEQEDMRESMKETMQEIKNWQKQYLETIDAMVSANEAYYNKTIADYSNAMQQVVKTATDSLDLIVSAAQAAANAIAAAGDKAQDGWNKINGGEATVTSIYAKGDHDDPESGTWIVKGVDKNGNPFETEVDRFDNTGNLIPKEEVITQIEGSFATGGYTGSWGPEGKIAMLHEKELVLNKSDTKNMLDMVNTLRDIDWRAKLSELWTNIEEHFITPIFGGGDNLQQDVHIEASFPNVVEHSEIEEAFNNLINTASQYANRKLF